tara:strand:+ start:77 stop:1150 length:1074 start_codon:yes stop_codon:yes gene_type:complete
MSVALLALLSAYPRSTDEGAARVSSAPTACEALPAKQFILSEGVWQRAASKFAGHRRLSNFVVNLGANDGVGMNDPLAFWLTKSSATGIAVEYDAKYDAALHKNYPSANVTIMVGKPVTPDNVGGILRDGSTPNDPLVLKVDIDSYDVDVVRAILRLGYRPHIFVVEANEKVPPGVVLAVRYTAQHGWRWGYDHVYGNSISAWHELFGAYSSEYVLLGLSFNQLIYARRSSMIRGQVPANTSIECAFEEGYYNMAEKPKYNGNVAHWLDESKSAKERLQDLRSYILSSKTRRLVGIEYPIDARLERRLYHASARHNGDASTPNAANLPRVHGSCDALRRCGSKRVQYGSQTGESEAK